MEKKPFITLEQAKDIIKDIPTHSIFMTKRVLEKMLEHLTRLLVGTKVIRNILQ